MLDTTAEDIVDDIGEDLLCVPPETPIHDAVRLMVERDRYAVLIRKDADYIGIWTERDLMRNTVLEGFDPKTTTVGEHMSFPLKPAPHTDNIFQFTDTFLGYQKRHLILEKYGKYIGILYARDVIRAGFTGRIKQLRELDEMVSLEFYENWTWKKKNR